MSTEAVCPEVAVFDVLIPGEPIPQGRPRAFRAGRFVRVYDPPAGRKWKEMAAALIAVSRGGRELPVTFPAGPLELQVHAEFTCLPSDARKREPRPRRRQHTRGRGDVDNLAKAAMDAATDAGLWTDDHQIARLIVEKWIAPQGEPPFVALRVRPLT